MQARCRTNRTCGKEARVSIVKRGLERRRCPWHIGLVSQRFAHSGLGISGWWQGICQFLQVTWGMTPRLRSKAWHAGLVARNLSITAGNTGDGVKTEKQGMDFGKLVESGLRGPLTEALAAYYVVCWLPLLPSQHARCFSYATQKIRHTH